MVTRRLTKTISYKVSVILITQILLYFIFREIIINFSMGIIEIVRIGWYYCFDWLFDEKVWINNERY